SFQGISVTSEARRVGLCGSEKAYERYLGLLVYSQRCYEVFGVVRSSAMRRTGLHRPYNGAEKVFLAELALLGRFAEIDEMLFYSRWHDQRFSANASAIAQALHMNPSAPRRFAWPRQIRSSWGYLAAIGQLPLTAAERLQCLAVFGRYLLQLGKWQRVLREAITGRGTTALLPERTSECGDSSPLWTVAERPFLSFADGVKESGSAAVESGDKSPHSKEEINA
ncbi:MAG TPA: hypothetical protein VFI31_28200, partial [Pirellulales bacterium]|nr:hypothetical protein [Pirellulales bacterium]